MEWYQLLSIVATVGIGLVSVIGVLLWYIIRSLVSDMKALEQDLEAHKLYDANIYAKMADVNTSFDKVIKRLDEMQLKINEISVAVGILTSRQ